jgi:hypothetical protein
MGLVAQVKCQADQTHVGGDAQRRQNENCIAAGAELMTVNPIFPKFSKELAISLGATEESDDENAGTVDCKQGTNTVELGGEDLEHNKSERELGESCPDVSSFEGTLGSTHFDNLI